MSNDKVESSWTRRDLENVKGRRHFRNLDGSRRIILKCVLNTNNMRMCPEIAWFGIMSSGVNEPSG